MMRGMRVIRSAKASVGFVFSRIQVLLSASTAVSLA